MTVSKIINWAYFNFFFENKKEIQLRNNIKCSSTQYKKRLSTLSPNWQTAGSHLANGGIAFGSQPVGNWKRASLAPSA